MKHFCTLPWLKIEPKLGKTTCRGSDILWMTLYFDGMGGQDVLHRNVWVAAGHYSHKNLLQSDHIWFMLLKALGWWWWVFQFIPTLDVVYSDVTTTETA